MEVGGGETVEQIAARLDAKSEYAPLRATGMVILFLALWSIDLWIFKRARLDISCIYPAKILGGSHHSYHPPPFPPVSCTPRRMGLLSGVLLTALILTTLLWSEVVGGAVTGSLLMFYGFLLLVYLNPLDPTLSFRDLGVLVGRVLYLVFVPGEEVHFLEVLVGDILTSLSKVFQEAGLVILSLSHDVGLGHYIPYYQDLLPATMASVPFVLRIHQCYVCYRNAPTPRARFLHALNILKYCSSLPGIWLPICLAPHRTTAQIERLLLWFLLANSLYSYAWDVLMDWGLGHCRGRYLGLRPTLLFARPSAYYGAMGADLGLRLLWVLKYLEFDHLLSYDRFMFLIEVLEVLRRSMWAVFRVEWECLNKNFGGLDGRDSEEEEEETGPMLTGKEKDDHR